MKTPDLETKRTFLVASSNTSTLEAIKDLIEKHIAKATVFLAQDGQEAFFKASNVPPQVAIIDSDLTKINNFDLTRQLLAMIRDTPLSIILISAIPEKEEFVDEIVTGHVQFLKSLQDDQVVSQVLTKALNAVSVQDNSTYHLKFLAKGDFLFLENTRAESVFIVKRGELEAIKGTGEKAVVLGKVTAGEFVGEMSHFNAEARSASVRALSDSELIEIPHGTLDMVLFSKPAWSKALIATLSRRLKHSNIRISAQ